MSQLALSLPDNYSVAPPPGIPQGGVGQIQTILQFGVTLILVVSMFLALGFLIYGGVKWLSSGGEKGSIDSARKTVTYSIVGLLVILLSFFTINIISGLFGVNFFPQSACSSTNHTGYCTPPAYCSQYSDGHWGCRTTQGGQ